MKTLVLLFFYLTSPIFEADSLDRLVDEIHSRIISLDTHNDFSIAYTFPSGDYGVKKGQVSFDLMKKGHLDGAFFAAYLEQGPRTPQRHAGARDSADAMLNALKGYAAEHSALGSLAYNADDVRALKKQGLRAMILSIENAYCLGNDLSLVQHYYDMGVRMISLSHNGTNEVCDAAVGEEEYGGLSAFGYKVVEEMNRLGIIVDVAHGSKKTCLDAVKASKVPIMSSHTAVYNMKQIPRNLTDEEMLAIAGRGGLIQVSIGRYFLSWLPKYRVGLDYLISHINYVVNLVGIEHVGIGSDFDGGGGMIGCEDMGEMKEITRALLEEGYNEEEISLLWGGNILRLMDACECGK